MSGFDGMVWTPTWNAVKHDIMLLTAAMAGVMTMLVLGWIVSAGWKALAFLCAFAAFIVWYPETAGKVAIGVVVAIVWGGWMMWSLGDFHVDEEHERIVEDNRRVEEWLRNYEAEQQANRESAHGA